MDILLEFKPAVVDWSVYRLLHKNCHMLAVVQISLGTKILIVQKYESVFMLFK